MKKIILFLIIGFSLVNAQDSEPTPWDFKWGFSVTPRPFVLDSFPQTSFLTGFQWSGSNRMDNALFNNAKTGRYFKSESIVPDSSVNWLFQPSWIDGSDYHPGYFGAVMMQYEPTLPITTSNFGNILRPADDSDPIFGFLNRKGRILTDDTDANYSRIELMKLSIIDLVGNEIGIIDEGLMNNEHYIKEYNVSSLPTGAYFIRLELGNDILINKFVKE